MLLKRFIKSLINMLILVPIINLVMLLMNRPSLGESATNIKVAKNQNERYKYAAWSIVQVLTYVTIVGYIVTIYFWATSQPSLAERFSGLEQKEG